MGSVVDAALEPIRAKVQAGERLSLADGLALYQTRDLFSLGENMKKYLRGLFNSREELDFVKAKVAAKEEPWFSALTAMRKSPAGKLDYKPNGGKQGLS